ncbi:MAG TPA: hypothetical protein VN764_18885 [Polyangiaceae bacterium]|nr:hypothetical protein [Polyangiaceae bacterium]
MSISDAAELKKRLRTLGFEIYRTVDGQVTLAERIRDNLIMDSGIVVGPVGAYGEHPEQLSVSVTLRAQASHFPGASADQVRSEALTLARDLLHRGYVQADFLGRPMLDPGDPAVVLDTSHELRVVRIVEETELAVEVQHLLSVRRASSDE